MSKWWLCIDGEPIHEPRKVLNLPLASNLPDRVKQRIINQECEELGVPITGAKLIKANELPYTKWRERRRMMRER